MNLRALSSVPRIPRQSKFTEPILWRRATAIALAVLLVPFASIGAFAQSGYPPQSAPQAQQDYPPPPPDMPQALQAYQQPQQDYPLPPPNYAQPQTDQPYQQSYPQQSYPEQPPYPPQSQYQQAPQYQQPDPYSQQPQYQQPNPDQAYSQPYDDSYQPYAAPQQPQSAVAPDQLDQLVAPIALYPDQLIAQILAAATYPMQIAEADRWRQSMGDAPPAEIAAGANTQPWDPSVKALTAFPQVLADLDHNLSWTTELGNAYYNQPQDVFSAIQAMRQRAQAAGTLQSSPQEQVTNDQGYIDIAPANPQVVYVPTYDPWAVYGAPVNPWPGFELLGAIGDFGVRFGPGLVMSAFTAMPWGWLGWGLSWLGSCLFFDHGGYYPHGPGLRDWGLRYGGPRAPWGRNFAYARAYDHGFNRGFNRGFDRGAGNRGYSARGGYENRGGSYARGGFDGRSGFNGNRGYAENRGFDNRGFGNRGFAQNRSFADPRNGSATRPGYGYGNAFARSPQQAWNREPGFNARSSPGGYGNYGRTPGYSAPTFRSSSGYGRPSAPSGISRGFGNSFRQSQPTYRSAPRSAPMSSYRAFGGSSSGFANRGFSQSRSLGGRHNFYGGGRSESTPRFSSHSFSGGGHSSFGGGGHSFGGGGHSGGGHSFGGGGHSGGGHSGGGGHRH